MKNELAKKDVSIEGGLVKLSSMTDAMQFCDQVFNSGLAPTSFRTPQAIFGAIQMGAELGMRPMQALQSLAVVNGRVSLMDKAARGVVAHSGLLEDCQDYFEGSGDDLTAFCKLKRKGVATPFIGKFSVAQAKKAQLWGKAGPWTMYPQDMMMHKASARAHALGFSDILIGLAVTEDIQDTPSARIEPVNPNPVSDPLLDSLPTIDVESETLHRPCSAVIPAPLPPEFSEPGTISGKIHPNDSAEIIVEKLAKYGSGGVKITTTDGKIFSSPYFDEFVEFAKANKGRVITVHHIDGQIERWESETKDA